jgi:hypothetical protein
MQNMLEYGDAIPYNNETFYSGNYIYEIVP